ncbi:MAG: ClpXP protease specificity-enhancing factor [Candidatus Methylumidiphilus alinenensis]|uniref:ClpXP protease specificity-enhancing factor n=1 Tax=Candidatus Methylumidiphilus alinenensis TaxID=2202197 RepID=A0A2W4QMQ2_9GAMM|nr:MAG: ClpXP protease specificity-enhancing factor [Candidatus Methylumidiphilus alinenensis]
MNSLKPYLLRAVYDWCVDNDLTPYLLANADADDVVIPRQSVQEGRIILNLKPQAVHNLALGDNKVEFNARFGGKPMLVRIPIKAVLAIYARENGQGMVFDENEGEDPLPPQPTSTEPTESKPARSRPVLKVVK